MKAAVMVLILVLPALQIRAAEEDVPPAVQAVIEDQSEFYKSHPEFVTLFDIKCPRWKTNGNDRVDVLVRESGVTGRATVTIRTFEQWLPVERIDGNWQPNHDNFIYLHFSYSLEDQALDQKLLDELEKPNVSRPLISGVLKCAALSGDDRFIDLAIRSLSPGVSASKPDFDLLPDRHWLLASNAAKYLGAMKATTAVPALLKHLEMYPQKDGYEIARREIVKSLGLIGDPVAVPVLEELMETEIISVDDKELVAESCLALARLGVRKHLPRMAEFLLDDEILHQDEYIRALAEIDAKSLAPQLVAILKKEEAPEYIKGPAVSLLLEWDREKYQNDCLKLLQSDSAFVPEEIANRIAEKKLVGALSILRSRLKEMMEAEGTDHSPQSNNIPGLNLVEFQSQLDGDASPLGQRRIYGEAVQPLFNLKIERYRNEKQAFMLALMALGDSTYIQYLPSMVMSEQREIERLTNAFEGLGPKAAPLLKALLASDDWMVRFNTARAVAPAKSEELQTILSSHLVNEDDPDVRAVIQKAEQ